MAKANHKGVSFMCPFYYNTKEDDNKAWLQLSKEQIKEIAKSWRLAKKILQNRRKRREVIKTNED